MTIEEIKLQKDFLYAKLNLDMSPEETDKFIPIIIKELVKLRRKL